LATVVLAGIAPAAGARHRVGVATTAATTVSVHAGWRRFCPRRHVLRGVWGPKRLSVLDGCRRAAGKVAGTALQRDGDLHVYVQLNAPYRSLINKVNVQKKGGALVIELMPRDGSHLPAPRVGDRVTIVGAWVTDHLAGGWHELHPVWALSIDGSRWYASGPRFGGSPASATESNARAKCRGPHGQPCRGY
jgi:hypothetical protein